MNVFKKLKNVQCIACHEGSNLPHGKKFTVFLKIPTEKTCTTCHTSKNSPKFNYSEYKHKIKHWNEL